MAGLTFPQDIGFLRLYDLKLHIAFIKISLPLF